MVRVRSLPVVRSKRVFLRFGTPRDIGRIITFYDQNRLFFQQTSSPRPPDFYTRPFWRQRLAADKAEFRADQSCRFFLFRNRSPDEVIGAVSFFGFIRGSFHGCILGYALAEKEQGQGLMTEAVRAAVRFVFSELNMHRVMANYLPENARSGALLERVGFQVEGYARKYLLVNGVWRDHYNAAITNPKWIPEAPPDRNTSRARRRP